MYYKELEVWKESIKLVTYVYQITENYPKTEQFGIISQIRRCVISIPQISRVNALLNGLINYYNKQLKDNTALVP